MSLTDQRRLPATAATPSGPAARIGPDPARTRIEALLDPQSFRPDPSGLEPPGLEPPEDGVVTGTGRISGDTVVVYATDGRIQGGALGGQGCERIVAAIRAACDRGCPVIGIWHSGGARLAEGSAALDGVGRVFAAMVGASGRVPQLSLVLGPAAGGAAYGPALTDVVILGPAGRLFVTGPDVVRRVTGEDVDALRLGGPEPHGRRSGVVHVVADTDAEALDATRRLVTLLASPGRVEAASVGDDAELGTLLPTAANRAYDVRPLVSRVLDRTAGAGASGPIELQPRWAPNVVTTLGRLGGGTVGVVANNPLRLGGCLDAAAAEKAGRFVRTCDAFGIPLVVLVDVPGYLPGVGQEWDGVVRRGAKLLHAFAAAVVPRVTVITRKAYGGAYIAMNSRSLGATAVYAWAGAEVAVMGASAAVEILHRRRLADTVPSQRSAVHAALTADHSAASGGLERAVDLGAIDAVIDPAWTRRTLAAAIASAPPRRGRHGNIPL